MKLIAKLHECYINKEVSNLRMIFISGSGVHMYTAETSMVEGCCYIGLVWIYYGFVLELTHKHIELFCPPIYKGLNHLSLLGMLSLPYTLADWRFSQIPLPNINTI